MSVDSSGGCMTGSGFGAGRGKLATGAGVRRDAGEARGAGRSAGARAPRRSGRPQPLPLRSGSHRTFPGLVRCESMEQPGRRQPPQEQPWGRLLRLGAEEGEPHVLLRKREWTIGRREVRGGERAWETWDGRGDKPGDGSGHGGEDQGPGMGVGDGD